MLALCIHFAINGDGGSSIERRPRWLDVALVARRWREPASTAFLETAVIDVMRAAEVPTADAARMRSVELAGALPLSGSRGDAASYQSIKAASDALDALRPALSGLRVLTLKRCDTLLDGHRDYLSMLGGARRGLVFARGMEGLRVLRVCVTDIAAAFVPLPNVPASLQALSLGVELMFNLDGLPAHLVKQLRIAPIAEIVTSFQASAHSLRRLDLAIVGRTTGDDVFGTGLVRAFLQQHPNLNHFILRTRLPTTLRPEHVAALPSLRTVRFCDVVPSVATLEALGCAGVRELALGRSTAVAACAWPAIITSAALPSLTVARVEAIARAAGAAAEVWLSEQRAALADACARRGITLHAFWQDD